MAEDGTEPALPVAADGPQQEAPYGYIEDPKTGERRPRKRAGRAGLPQPAPAPVAGASPSLDELRATAEDRRSVEDRAPGAARRGRGRPKAKPAAEPPPPFREGPIAKGMNKLYLRIGKIVKAMDRDIGVAVIAITKKETEDDVTVGEAWEELARTNPRIRAFLLRLIEGGAWTQLIMIHAPIAIAIVMKDGIRRHIPFHKFLDALMADDDDGQDGGDAVDGEAGAMLGGLLSGMTSADMAQVGAMFNGIMGQAAANVPRSNGHGVPVRMPVPAGDEPAGGP